MKYRRLSDDELKELEQEFKQFLIANAIYDDEWKSINQDNPDKALELVEMFSDMVMEKALKNIKYLEHVSKNSLNAFHCTDKEIELIGVTTNDEKVDFNEDTFNKFKHKLNIFKTNKPYYKSREEEVFELLETGCSIITEERFNKILMAYQYSSKQMKN